MRGIKIKETYLLFLIVMGLVSLAVYSTYALFTASTEIENVVDFTATLTTDSSILEYEMVRVPAGEVKIIEVDVVNSYSSGLYYGAWYEMVSPSSITEEIEIGTYTDEDDTPSSGTIAANTTINLLVGIKNTGSSEIIVNIGTVGSLTSSLGLSDSRTLIPEGFNPSMADITITNIMVDGEAATAFPTGNYTVALNCTGATATFDYEANHLKITNVNAEESATCSSSFNKNTATTYLNSHIISLSGTTQGDGKVVNEYGGYRYEGKNPNNYIKFNNEMWRIIGVFDSNSHGVTGTNLTKIIRNESIGGNVWDKDKTNIWPTSSLYNLLNTYYYNATNGQDSGYCYQYSTTITGHCDYRNIGIQDYYRKMVKNVTWYLGGYRSSSFVVSIFYTAERSTSDDNYYNTNYKTTTGYIGLMYASDYGCSALSSSCARTTQLDSYSSKECGGSSWIKKEMFEWTITQYTFNSAIAFGIGSGGGLGNSNTSISQSTRPVLYLDSSVYILNGTGTESDPYIVGYE